jgi:hypothetical protein
MVIKLLLRRRRRRMCLRHAYLLSDLNPLLDPVNVFSGRSVILDAANPGSADIARSRTLEL